MLQVPEDSHSAASIFMNRERRAVFSDEN